ncbi:hypothetical protein WN55_10948 [Dufourea novaeangliae]|uniref:Uncharacterized protein n=1 Tax=Dufourea novaeangliae TaxID=178035 RepID=A0A154P8G6_DUFNO|nr:hypothetical protein WN55_10948 [Dufourea novaeangliae]
MWSTRRDSREEEEETEKEEDETMEEETNFCRREAWRNRQKKEAKNQRKKSDGVGGGARLNGEWENEEGRRDGVEEKEQRRGKTRQRGKEKAVGTRVRGLPTPAASATASQGPWGPTNTGTIVGPDERESRRDEDQAGRKKRDRKSERDRNHETHVEKERPGAEEDRDGGKKREKRTENPHPRQGLARNLLVLSVRTEHPWKVARYFPERGRKYQQRQMSEKLPKASARPLAGKWGLRKIRFRRLRGIPKSNLNERSEIRGREGLRGKMKALKPLSAFHGHTGAKRGETERLRSWWKDQGKGLSEPDLNLKTLNIFSSV